MIPRAVRILRLMPSVVWTCLIFRLMLSESSGLPRFWWLDFPYSDKLVHAGVFGVGSALIVLGLMKSSKSVLWTVIVMWALGVGAFTEYYQHCCLHTRTGEMADLLSDLVGACLPPLLLTLRNR